MSGWLADSSTISWPGTSLSVTCSLKPRCTKLGPLSAPSGTGATVTRTFCWDLRGAAPLSTARTCRKRVNCVYFKHTKTYMHKQKNTTCPQANTVSVSVSAQDGIVALGKAHTRSAPSLSSLPKVALETVPIFVWLNTDRSRPWRVECRPLPFSTPLSFRRSML